MAQTNCTLTIIGKHTNKLERTLRFYPQSSLIETRALSQEFKGRFDVAIDATGSPSGLATALEVVKPRGTVVLKSTHHGTTAVDTSRVVVNELKIVGSRCGKFRAAIDLLAGGAAGLETLISRRLPLEAGLIAFDEASASKSLKVILQVA